MFRVFLLFSLFATLPLAFANTITTEKSSQDLECKNQLPTSFCEQLVDNDDCANDNEDSTFRNGCLKSCGLCGENDVNEINRNGLLYDADEQPWGDAISDLPDGETKGGCEDKIPNCSSYLSVCCQMKDAMNVSCQKTCRFCSESPATPPPGLGIGETGSSHQHSKIPATLPNHLQEMLMYLAKLLPQLSLQYLECQELVPMLHR